MSLPICYLICGFLGAGKTTYSPKLSKETGAIHLNPDKWCMKLFSKKEYEQNWNKCFSETIEYLWKKVDYNLPHFDELKQQFEEPSTDEEYVLIKNY